MGAIICVRSQGVETLQVTETRFPAPNEERQRQKWYKWTNDNLQIHTPVCAGLTAHYSFFVVARPENGSCSCDFNCWERSKDQGVGDSSTQWKGICVYSLQIRRPIIIDSIHNQAELRPLQLVVLFSCSQPILHDSSIVADMWSRCKRPAEFKKEKPNDKLWPLNLSSIAKQIRHNELVKGAG